MKCEMCGTIKDATVTRKSRLCNECVDKYVDGAKYDGELEIDRIKRVIWFTSKRTGTTLLRISGLPEHIPIPEHGTKPNSLRVFLDINVRAGYTSWDNKGT